MLQRANLVNDRGIHICKSMIAWQKWGEKATPESAAKKGDKLVGDFYVLFDKLRTKNIENLVDSGGMERKEAEKKSPLLIEAQEMLEKMGRRVIKKSNRFGKL